jgi:PAS domain S-box-containing protein
LEASPDGVLVSRDGRVVLANPLAARLAGTAGPDDLSGRELEGLFDLDSRDVLRLWLSRLPHRSNEPIVVRFDRTQIEAELNGSVFAYDGGSHVQLVVRDISARRRAEAALRASEERLTLAFAGAQEGVWDWNLENGAVFYSARWKQMLGYDEDDIPPHVSAWERLLHPDDRSQAEALKHSLARGGRTYEGEFRLRHKAGHYICVLSRGFPVRRDPDGPVVRIVGTHLDITERKRAEAALRESEERLTLAFEGAQEGVWDWNLQTGAVVYSQRWKQMLGYADHEVEPHISAWERLLHPEDRPRARVLNESVLHGSLQTYQGEFRLRHKAGHFIQVLSRGFPVRHEPGGPVVRIVGTHFDLTERQRVEAERVRTEMLTRLVFAQEDERRRIAREMHDQFGEHLTALDRGIGSLRDACADRGDLLSRIDALNAVAQRLDRDVDHLVWAIRPTALDDLGLRAALANYVQDWSRRVGIRAELHSSGLLDHRLASEVETTLYRIAQEALTNVAKHATAGSVEVILERRPDAVLLIVEDNGVGFELGETNGGGFGLIGMKERAALVGATLQIESAVGKGTTVFVRMMLPAVDSAQYV